MPLVAGAAMIAVSFFGFEPIAFVAAAAPALFLWPPIAILLYALGVLAASWSGVLLGIVFAAFMVCGLWAFGDSDVMPRRFLRHNRQEFGFAVSAFFAFANFFVFSANLFPRQAIVFLAAVLAFGAILRAAVSRRPHTFILLLVTMELAAVLKLLPFGYVALAALATAWFAAATALERMHAAKSLTPQKIKNELLAAAAISAFIALVSGIRPR